MSVLTASRLAKSFGALDVFDNISVDIPHGAKIALVGPNGAGKSTLLHILIGREAPTEGAVARMRGLSIGFLPQNAELDGQAALWDEMLPVFDDLRAQEAELQALEAAMSACRDDGELEALIKKYGALQARFEAEGGYDYELRIRQVLEGLGFDRATDFNRPIYQLSGGQKTRAYLARLLLESPDLLVLDEPTNHLDIRAVEWLEGFLSKWDGALLMVSHDRYFMDRVAGVIWELNWGQMEVYRGNYSHYLTQREARHARLLAEYEAQQEFIAKEEDYIRRNIAGQNTRQAQGRRKRLERFLRDEVITRPRTTPEIRLRLDAEYRSGEKVLMTEGLVVGYHDDKVPLFKAPDITLYRREIAALIGPNGVGKTTFIKTILGNLAPLAGEARLGASVKIGYFAQGHEDLNHHNTVLDEILAVEHMPLSRARNYLATFLFQGDDVFQPISTLSGGEQGRVALAKLALGGANLLLLDEPTNHLDIPSQEILQAVLGDFAGTIILVTHDRYLIDALATQIWALDEGEMVVFEGPYKEYLQTRSARPKPQAPDSKPAPPKPAPEGKSNGQPRLSAYARRKRLEEVERAIERLEVRLVELSGDLRQASEDSDVDRVRELGEAYAGVQAALEAQLAEWESLLE
ncbi:MAG: ABC-F family ATP-binding cassette domain-containing protein [Anaerolineae bacterium]|nr:ABC-F family ATP-binding cassette domain-containing protein [Anaerolineae bacterium]